MSREWKLKDIPDHKVCKKCGKTKSISDFYFVKREGKRIGVKYYPNSICKECNSRSWSADDISPRDKKQILVNIKGGKCERCGYSKCIAALDFHHRDPGIKSKITIASMSINDAIEELKKCDLLCSNCHREEHWRINDKIDTEIIDD